jgi:hypothetical protein
MSLSTPNVDGLCPGDQVLVDGEDLTILAIGERYIDYETSSGERRQITLFSLELQIGGPDDG